MNFLNDKDFESKLDGLLAESVRPGAEPADLSFSFPPRRPRLRGGLVFAGIVACLLIFSGLVLLIVQNGAVVSSAGLDFGSWLQEWMLLLVAPEMLVYTGLTVATAYYFLFTRLAHLLRCA